jgi:hypothetical protein
MRELSYAAVQGHPVATSGTDSRVVCLLPLQRCSLPDMAGVQCKHLLALRLAPFLDKIENITVGDDELYRYVGLAYVSHRQSGGWE